MKPAQYCGAWQYSDPARARCRCGVHGALLRD
jgi:hypothetical protein